MEDGKTFCNEFKSYYIQEPIEQDIYFKFVCFYMSMSEMYDRGLTDKRSPYDETEAYITGESRKYSTWYSKRLYDHIVKYIEQATKSPFDIRRWKKEMQRIHSAQGWINAFDRLKNEGDEIILDMLEYIRKNERKEEKVISLKNIFLYDIAEWNKLDGNCKKQEGE